MSGLKILHVTSELAPYMDENPLSTSVYQIAKKMYDDGNDVRIFMPKFGTINERRYQLHEVIRLSGINLIINDLDQPLLIKVASLPGERMQVYFIDNEEYFKRKSIYGDEETPWFEDNDDRSVFFGKGVLETIKKLNWVPDIIHVHGWMASVLPIYLKEFYSEDSFFVDTQLITSVYNNNYKDKLTGQFKHILSFDELEWNENTDITTIIKKAMELSDYVIKGEEVLVDDLQAFYDTLTTEQKSIVSAEDLMEKYNQGLVDNNVLN